MTQDPLDHDPESAVVLDDYLQAIQAGRRPDREAILRAHPALAGYLDCIDVLEGLASVSGIESEACVETPVSLVDESPAPRDFGSYELLNEVGRGGMGVVYRARQKGLDRIVAVKMVLAGHLASPEHIRRFHDEARAAAGLRHANIVHIHEVGMLHGQHFFVMEYIEGKSLAERIAERSISPEVAVRLMRKVALAVEHLHQHGIVHRDLKPSNILIDAEGEPFVSDFGLAKYLTGDSQRTATGVIAGTPSYMAPEQASGQSASVGTACDIYSLGAILYELLTGRPPFQEENPFDTLLQVLGGEPIPPRQLNRSIPRDLERICLKCLSRKPEDRYPSAVALADELDRYLKGEVLTARSPGAWQRFWSWARRQPAFASRLAILSAFYTVDLANYAVGIIDRDFHAKMSLLLGVWILGTVVFQQWLKSGRWSVSARFFWGALDTVLLLSALLVADGAASPLVVGYFLLITASGLWNRVRFVFYMTALQVLSYGILVFDFYHARGETFRAIFRVTPDRHAIMVLGMVAMAIVVAYLVERVRALSTYFGQRV